MKKVIIALMAAGFLLIIGGVSFAADSAAKPDAVTQATVVKGKALDVGNKICPVSGAPVGESKVTYTYKGKLYHLCCNDCVAVFKKDPKKYSAIAEKEIDTVKAAAVPTGK